ncbi:S66 family peptidase [Aliidiomarina minuta]|uniref:S66 family peptidase n=1 Tax=Aliidiomarina minuta TaxID=880057 RepID=UPI0018E59E98|nr:S66 peptidase family protein [Aliidiomarina minuta]
MKFPKPLQSGATIGVTAPSSGVEPALHSRLDLALTMLRKRGFSVKEGNCLRSQTKDTSAPAKVRAEELMTFLIDPEIDAIMPPWGGQRAIELLPHMDFERLKSCSPKWFCGFSDISTLHMPLSLIAGWPTLHGPNLMELAATPLDANTAAIWDLLGCQPGQTVEQQSSRFYQQEVANWLEDPTAGLQQTEPTRWRRLDQKEQPLQLQGQLIGGCLDTLSRLAGTVYGDVPGFIGVSSNKGVLLYLENAQMEPLEMLRALKSLEFHGWFSGISGLLLGRNTGPDASSDDHVSYIDALHAVFDSMPYPTLYDVDIGHKPPQLSLVNLACATVDYAKGGGSVTLAFDDRVGCGSRRTR